MAQSADSLLLFVMALGARLGTLVSLASQSPMGDLAVTHDQMQVAVRGSMFFKVGVRV